MIDSEIFRESLKWKSDEELCDMLLRATGLSTKIVDELVQEFFNEPYGTPIPVCDHYSTRQSDEFLFNRLAKRIEQEHRSKFHREYRNNRVCIVRDEPTMHELIKEELNRRTGTNIPEPPKRPFKYKLRYR